jgi:hypothetical protein
MNAEAPAQPPSIRGVVPSLIIDGLVPYVVYKLLTSRLNITEVPALALSAVIPSAHAIIGVVRRRQLDFFAIVVLVGIVVSAAATLAGGGPKLLLIRESFVTGAIGLVALSSFAWRRPLLFYIGRQFSAGSERAAVERFNGLWQYPAARRTFRVLTAVWAIAWLGEFALRVGMVLTLSVSQVLAIAPFVFNGITLTLLGWTFAYVRRQKRGRVERQSEAE